MGGGTGSSGEMPVSREVKAAGGVGAAGVMLLLGYGYVKPKFFFSLVGDDASKYPVLRVIVHSANKRLFVQSGLFFSGVTFFVALPGATFYCFDEHYLASMVDAFKRAGNTDIEFRDFELGDDEEKTKKEFSDFLNTSSVEYPNKDDQKRRERDVAIFSQFVGPLLRFLRAHLSEQQHGI